ncbi:hypothetical protein SAT01_16780 [Sinomonas atrocyanea]|nr:hypothetical protein SAT01_16780 [Sinomonas atrocyanea]GGG57429.1 hypothetical protein GCM10007172_05390 [Sinomonas atrocyanea]
MPTRGVGMVMGLARKERSDWSGRTVTMETVDPPGSGGGMGPESWMGGSGAKRKDRRAVTEEPWNRSGCR